MLDDSTVTKEDLKQLNESWETLCQQSVDKQDRLDAAHKAAVKFERGFSGLVAWIDQQVEELQAQPDPDEDANELQRQIDENQVRGR